MMDWAVSAVNYLVLYLRSGLGVPRGQLRRDDQNTRLDNYRRRGNSSLMVDNLEGFHCVDPQRAEAQIYGFSVRRIRCGSFVVGRRPAS